jgi:DNA (cytosine-5)-methyltransferase 1
MNYLSVCSGIEAATVAWRSLGWKSLAFSEIERFPSEVLKYHYPETPNLGDMTNFKEWTLNGRVELLVGGTPCQSFSVAGLRKGLDDPRGNLALVYFSMAARFNPRWIVWENVPGVLSSNGGRDFGSFLGALGQLGYGFAYRVLDAQFFGVAQRRRRVFVVGYLGDWRPAAAVLFERESLSRHPAPSREKGETIAPTVTSGPPFSRPGNERVEAEALVAARMRGFGDYECDGTASALKARDYKDATDLIAFPAEMSGTQAATATDIAPALSVSHTTALAYSIGPSGGEATEVAPTLDARCKDGPIRNQIGTAALYRESSRVRRLTPTECERLQGFPDGYTNIKKNCPDGPRYKALGNSMAVPVMRWIGIKIQKVEKILC